MNRSLLTGFFAIAAVAALLAPLGLDRYYQGMATEMLIYALFAMSLDLLLGYAGLASLGHAAFFGIGGYVVALSALRFTANFWFTLPAALLAAAAVGALFALFALRARGGYFLMITLALAQVLWGIAFGWAAMTGGEHGLPNVPGPQGLPFSLDDAQSQYLFTLVLAALGAGLLWLIANSPVGYAFRGIRESESRMVALGYNVWVYKYVAFVLSALFAGLAGALWVYYNRFANPEFLHVAFSAKVLLMVAIGGAGTLFGPAIGGAAVVVLEKVLSSYTDRWLFFLGAIYVLITFFAPHGVMGWWRSFLARLRPHGRR
jgi:branched-chain amino acid transport system permease protein